MEIRNRQALILKDLGNLNRIKCIGGLPWCSRGRVPGSILGEGTRSRTLQGRLKLLCVATNTGHNQIHT